MNTDDMCEITKVSEDGVAIQEKIPHIWQWLWLDGKWTGKVRCGTCNKIEQKGVENE